MTTQARVWIFIFFNSGAGAQLGYNFVWPTGRKTATDVIFQDSCMFDYAPLDNFKTYNEYFTIVLRCTIKPTVAILEIQNCGQLHKVVAQLCSSA